MRKSKSPHLLNARALWSSESLEIKGNAKTQVLNTSANTQKTTSLEAKLVDNLKRQVKVLDAEVAVLRDRLRKGAQGTHVPGGEGAHAAVGAPESTGNEVNGLLPNNEAGETRPTATEFNDGDKGAVAQPTSARQTQQAVAHFTTEHLRMELEAAREMLERERSSKKALIDENVNLRLLVREARDALKKMKQLHQTALSSLNLEQGRRRELEDKLLDPTAAHMREGGTGTVDDLLNEKEYYRVQTDRLRVSQQENLSRIESLESQLKEERAHGVDVETKLRASIEEVEYLKMLSAKKAAVYERFDSNCVSMFSGIRLAIEECERLRASCTERPGALQDHALLPLSDAVRELQQILTTFNHPYTWRGAEGGAPAVFDNPCRCGRTTTVLFSEKGIPGEAAAVPAPPAAAVPAPPAAAVPAPPAAAVPAPPAAAVPVPSCTIPISTSIRQTTEEELEEVKNKISEAEAALLACLKQ
ncbi:hypothetical protein TRVL_05245 [Trypanosoma vivax]|nr:hypothetical protein TRVL_05245 [Trypanosoma vivax]